MPAHSILFFFPKPSPMLELQHITLSRNGVNLIENADARIHPGQRVGLTGRNGSGKSTLLALLRHEIDADSGDYRLPPDWRIASVAQETPSLPDSALDYVLAGHAPYQAALAAITAAEQSGDGHAIARAHDQFAACDGYAQPARAAELLDGLGFPPDEQHRAVASYSGGWRMRLNLARALIAPAELLLLDEPTNHLDLDAIIWLQDYLKTHPATQIIIAHDREFLDALCTRILHIENRQLQSYTGNYSDYERQNYEQRLQADAQYQKQARQRAHLQSYIDRFRAKATKARQAQSRLKALEKLDAAPPPPPEADYQLAFQPAENHPNPALIAQKARLGYGDKTILQEITLRIAADARIGILGRNGAGKSTLMKALAGELAPLSGSIEAHKNTRIGYFTQHQLDALRGEHDALWHLQRILPQESEQQHRNRLGGYGFHGDKASAPVGQYSGGEKARLALALIIAQRPNLLLLDEPTNHLDLAMRDALTLARQNYDGAMLIISHDRSLLRVACDEFRLVADGKLQPFDGDLEDYHRYLNASRQATDNTAATPANSGDSRQEQKRREAEQRQRLRPLKQAVEAQEKTIAKLEAALEQHKAALADPALYEAENKEKLKETLAAQSDAQKALDAAEAAWMEAAEALQAAEQAAG